MPHSNRLVYIIKTHEQTPEQQNCFAPFKNGPAKSSFELFIQLYNLDGRHICMKVNAQKMNIINGKASVPSLVLT